MIIRRKLGEGICVIVIELLFFIILKFFNLEYLIFIILIGLFFLVPKLYDLIFLDSNSTSALYAGKIALENGFNPVDPNGKVWNPRDLKISEVYNLYKNNVKNVPEQYSAGFMFYTNKKKTISKKMEFYDYRNGGESFIRYNFYFHPYEDGDKITQQEMFVKELTDKMVFVALPELPDTFAM